MRIVRVRVYCTEGHGESYTRFLKLDYTYCVFVFGILVHSVKLYNMEQTLALHLFGSKIEDITEKYRGHELNKRNH